MKKSGVVKRLRRLTRRAAADRSQSCVRRNSRQGLQPSMASEQPTPPGSGSSLTGISPDATSSVSRSAAANADIAGKQMAIGTLLGKLIAKAAARGGGRSREFSVKGEAVMENTMAKSKVGLSVGIDMHKDQLTIVVLQADGQVHDKRRISCRAPCRIKNYFIALPRPWHAAVEAVGFYHWLWDLIDPIADKLVLANAVEVRRRAGTRPKTDYRDATWLAMLLREGRFDEDHHLRCFVPDAQLRGLREMTRFRHRLARKLSHDKNSFRRILQKQNLSGPKTLDAQHALMWMKAYEDKLCEQRQFMLRQFCDGIIAYERQIDDAHRRIESMIVSDPEWSPQAELLMSVPGIGLLSAATLMAEIGDWQRFDHVNELVDYVGLAPRVFASDKTVRHGRINKTGPRDARWILQQAAWVAIRCDQNIKKLWWRIGQRAGRKKAAVAIARRMLVWMYFMICRDETFRRFDSKVAQ